MSIVNVGTSPLPKDEIAAIASSYGTPLSDDEVRDISSRITSRSIEHAISDLGWYLEMCRVSQDDYELITTETSVEVRLKTPSAEAAMKKLSEWAEYMRLKVKERHPETQRLLQSPFASLSRENFLKLFSARFIISPGVRRSKTEEPFS